MGFFMDNIKYLNENSENCKIPHMRDFLTLTLEKLTKLDISNSPPYGKNLIGNNGIKLLCKTKFLVL